MQKIWENIVIGSGPAAVMAAQTLVEAGKEVLMLDFGNELDSCAESPEGGDFLSLRENDSRQHRYFLGNEFEGLPDNRIKTGAQLTPSRKIMIRDVNDYLPVDSKNFYPMESLAKGGLGRGWGLGTYAYSDGELQKTGLPLDQMKSAYQVVADRIGVSVGDDEIKEYLVGNLKNTLPPIKPDNSISMLFDKFKKLNIKEKMYLGSPAMAILTSDFKGRLATDYSDMDFYDDTRKSAWRAQFVVDDLMNYPDFKYMKGYLVLKFVEDADKVVVTVLNTIKGIKEDFYAKKLFLTGGALSSARILLRSLDVEKLSLLCNPYTYMPAINLAMVGKPLSKLKSSMAQAMMIYDPDGKNDDLVSVAIYTYRSLLLQRLIEQSPLNTRANFSIFSVLQSAFVVAGIHHPDIFRESNNLRLKNADTKTGDVLVANFEITKEEREIIMKRESVIKSVFKRIGVFPIKRLDPGFGSSIHYAGTIPARTNPSLGESHLDGRVEGCKKVYSADSSQFNFLPAKGVTFSLMANAHRVASQTIENE